MGVFLSISLFLGCFMSCYVVGYDIGKAGIVLIVNDNVLFQCDYHKTSPTFEMNSFCRNCVFMRCIKASFSAK